MPCLSAWIRQKVGFTVVFIRFSLLENKSEEGKEVKMYAGIPWNESKFSKEDGKKKNLRGY